MPRMRQWWLLSNSTSNIFSVWSSVSSCVLEFSTIKWDWAHFFSNGICAAIRFLASASDRPLRSIKRASCMSSSLRIGKWIKDIIKYQHCSISSLGELLGTLFTMSQWWFYECMAKIDRFQTATANRVRQSYGLIWNAWLFVGRYFDGSQDVWCNWEGAVSPRRRKRADQVMFDLFRHWPTKYPRL